MSRGDLVACCFIIRALFEQRNWSAIYVILDSYYYVSKPSHCHILEYSFLYGCSCITGRFKSLDTRFIDYSSLSRNEKFYFFYRYFKIRRSFLSSKVTKFISVVNSKFDNKF